MYATLVSNEIKVAHASKHLVVLGLVSVKVCMLLHGAKATPENKGPLVPEATTAAKHDTQLAQSNGSSLCFRSSWHTVRIQPKVAATCLGQAEIDNSFGPCCKALATAHQYAN